MTDPSIWIVELKPFPDDERPIGRRVAAMLKYAKRACGLKCVVVRDPTSAELQAAMMDELGRETTTNHERTSLMTIDMPPDQLIAALEDAGAVFVLQTRPGKDNNQLVTSWPRLPRDDPRAKVMDRVRERMARNPEFAEAIKDVFSRAGYSKASPSLSFSPRRFLMDKVISWQRSERKTCGR